MHEWHEPIDFGYYNLQEMITGCGIMQLNGVINIPNDLTKEDLLEKFDEAKDNGVGAILATLGKDFWKDYHDRLTEQFGFEMIAEYCNYRHDEGGRYKQRLYIFKL